MPKFWVTIRETHAWEVEIEAEDSVEAMHRAEDLPLIGPPTYIYSDEIEIEDIEEETCPSSTS